jgi:pimeloyl-ACP methyl ester carboxylesterase
MLRSLVIAFAAAGLGWVALVALLAFTQRSVLYHPLPIDPALADRHRDALVGIDTNGASLKGWLLRHSDPAAPLVIFFGGNGDEASRYLPAFSSLSCCSVLAVNYRGYGESTGTPTESDLRADALAVYDAAQSLRAVPGPTVLFGRSLGTGMAISAAAQREVAGLVLVSPYDSITNVAREAFPWVPVRWLLKDRFECVDFARRIHSPSLVMAAVRDTVVRQSRSLTLAAALAGRVETVLLPGENHNSLLARTDIWQQIDAWIAEHVRH